MRVWTAFRTRVSVLVTGSPLAFSGFFLYEEKMLSGATVLDHGT
jgi:hypothetical protein